MGRQLLMVWLLWRLECECWSKDATLGHFGMACSSGQRCCFWGP
jgi:hypothetical protein